MGKTIPDIDSIAHHDATIKNANFSISSKSAFDCLDRGLAARMFDELSRDVRHFLGSQTFRIALSSFLQQRRAELGSSRSIGLSYRRAKGIMPPPEKPSTVKTRSMSDSDILSSLSSQLESLGKEMREFREESKSMGKSIDSTHDKIDEVKVLINAQQEDIEKCLDVIDNLKVENSQLQCELEQVKKELCDVQQSSRRNTVDIQGRFVWENETFDDGLSAATGFARYSSSVYDRGEFLDPG
ncbi:hypothetical protein J6590_057906 [Homalodisca vitripennis]|nr:hypothetical protein J6590_057906 [Homalodisca vitripennis]